MNLHGHQATTPPSHSPHCTTEHWTRCCCWRCQLRCRACSQHVLFLLGLNEPMPREPQAKDAGRYQEILCVSWTIMLYHAEAGPLLIRPVLLASFTSQSWPSPPACSKFTGNYTVCVQTSSCGHVRMCANACVAEMGASVLATVGVVL